MKSGLVPGRLLGPGQQKAQARGRKGVGKVSKSWKHEGVPWAGGTEKEAEGSRPERVGYDCTLSTWAERWWCQSRRRV